MGGFANAAIAGFVLIVIGIGLMMGADEAKKQGTDSNDTLVVIVDHMGFVLTIGGIGLAIVSGIGGGIKAAIEMGKKSTPAGIALAMVVAIASVIVFLMLFGA